ncbi:polysaccharide biosynthesis tyrosine autokinase [Plectonema cf. radiosum LEGE 06105]|uniref:Polysaccharide biosynthesis tyrosine autokinase n=1 Tax=Plectonema cf. radiosum LEGE 06105 TaxID=945769 RepID=A0A8J7K1K9_9CYAN|nr:polysaccharide biosynthesis tyrosine autokinase [Plectonema radiosum]MBE9211992.1 polysaccharide biosynthesis tyrosine autokinase [Plectonema cf. radiosum LEGE 06105]
MTEYLEKSPSQQSRVDSWELRQLFSVLRRRLFLIIPIALVITGGVMYRGWLQTPIYSQKFQLFLDSTAEGGFNLLSEQRQTSFIPPQFRDFKTEMEVLTSYKVISPLLPKIQSRYADLNYDKLVKNLKLKHLQETAIIEVSYQDTDPEKIKFILNQLKQAYTDYSLNKLKSSTTQAQKLVDTQLPDLKKRVDRLQGELQIFRRKYNLVDPQQQSQILSERLANALQQKQEALTLLGETQSAFDSLQGELGIDIKQARVISILSDAPRYLALQQQLQELENKLATDSTRLTSSHPAISDLLEKRQRILSLIRQEVVAVLGIETLRELNITELKQLPAISAQQSSRLLLTQKLIETATQLQGLQTRLKYLAAIENQTRKDLQQFAAVIRQYTDLNRKLEIGNESLSRFLTAKENLQIETARKVSPWQVISQIEAPKQPISPNIPRDLVLGGIAGVLAGVGVAIIVGKLDNKYHSPEELQNDTGQTFLGTIPYHKQLKTAPTQLSRNGTLSNSAYWEAYISLQTNLDFLEPDKPLKSLVISSALPGEGKSTISLYLAKIAAAMGKRVLLIDADLRNPTIHRYIDLTNTWGLSNAISGVAEAQDLIQTLPEEENLSVLTAGQTPPNPARLLASSKMKDLLLDFQSKYDLVIIDTPPLHGFADAKYVVSQADGLMMVVGLDKTEKPAVRQVLKDLELSHINLLGIVANGVKGYKPSYSGYYDYYYNKGKDANERYELIAAVSSKEQGVGREEK